MLKIIITVLFYFLYFESTFAFTFRFGDYYRGTTSSPQINCKGLPGCSSNTDYNIVTSITSSLIANLIQYVAVFAVVALVISGIMYILSGGDDAKTKNAKHWITRSLIGVFLSISAWAIINIINEFTIYN